MRAKTHWYRRDRAPAPEEVGAAAAMRAWRAASQTVRNLSEDGPVTDRAGGHLALVQELLLFAVQFTDRLCWMQGVAAETRRRLVEGMVLRLADGVEENAGVKGASSRFISLAGERLPLYASIAYEGEAPGFPSYNALAASACEACGHGRDTWLHARLVEVDGPEFIAELRPGLVGLLENLHAEHSA